MLQTRTASLLVAALTVTAMVGMAMPAVAQSDSVLSDFEDDEDEGWLSTDTLISGVAGAADRVAYWASSASPLRDEPDPTEQARADRAALQDVYNSHSNSIEGYVNARFSGTHSEYNVIKITHERDGEQATQYLVADVENSSFTNSTMTNSTDRSVDQTVVLGDYASAEAGSELEQFHEEYVTAGEDVDQAYMANLASKYKGHVETPEGVA